MNAVVPNKALIFLLIFIVIEFGVLSLIYGKRKTMVFSEVKKFYFFLFFISVIRFSSIGDFIFMTSSEVSLGIVIERT